MVAVRAVYVDGKFVLLDPVDLQPGQRVTVQFTLAEAPPIIVDPANLTREQEEALLHAALDGFVRWADPNYDDGTGISDEELEQILREAPVGGKTLSELIIEERHGCDCE